MRLLLLLVLTTVGSVSLSAQYDKGNWYLDVNSGIDYSYDPETLNSSFRSRMKGGYFLRDRLLVGAEFRNSSRIGQGFTDGDGLSLFTRYYLPNRKSTRLNFFGETALNLDVDDGLSAGLSIGVGAEYALAPGIMLIASLSGEFSGGSRGAIGGLNIGTNYIFGASDGLSGTPDYSGKKGDLMLDANFGNLSTNGRFYLGGEMNFYGGYFLSESLLVTGEVGFSRASYDLGIPTVPRSLEYTDFAVSTGLRYHFNNGKRLQPYLAAGLRYDYNRERRTNWTGGSEGTGTFSDSGLSGDLRAGILYHLNSSIAVDLGLGYQPLLSGNRPAEYNRFGGKIGFKIFIGD